MGSSAHLGLLIFGTLLATCWILAEAAPAKIPSYIHVCKKNDPNVDECIKKSIEELRPQLIKGIPEINVPSIEPLILPEVIVKGGSSAANFNAIGKNVKVHGASSVQINSLHADLDKNIFSVSGTFPNLFFESDYEVDAKILVLPVKGKGPLTANATNVKADVTLYGELMEKDGVKYLTFKDMDIKIKIDNYKVHLDNLFGGDKTLGDATNAALNEGNADFIRAVTPVVEKTTGEILLKIANQIASSFSYDDLFPEN